MKQKQLFAMGAATLALVGSVALASPALAHGPGGPGGFGRGFGLGRGEDRGSYLAQELGISVETLRAAQLKALEKGLAEAVKAGRLTQEQADLRLAGAKLAAAIDHDAVMAEALGISVAELQAARDAGKTLRDLLAERKLDAQTFRTKLQAAMDKAIAKAVADGVISQAQADALKAARDSHGRGPGAPGGPGGGRGPRQNGASEDPASLRVPAPSGSGL